jgi:glutathione-dependent peroxiredoxin
MLFNHDGQCIPQVTFRMFVSLLSEVCWYNLSTADLFKNKTVVVFTVPGAFVPYSHIQLSGYNNYGDIFRSNGVDDILCISVNDPFSLANWAQAAGVDRVRCIPDVNGDFTRELGMMVNLSERGMGQRSWRYSMLVKNEVIEKMFIEQDGFEALPVVTNAETMLQYINPEAKKFEQTMLAA